MKLIRILFIFTCFKSFAFDLQNGDILFQDTNCGSFCDAIDSVTIGYHNSYVSHAGIVIQSNENYYVVEAISTGVVKTPLKKFLARSLDDKQNPRVMVGRLKTSYQYLIPSAIKFASAQLGKPYNSTFVPNSGISYYCSDLIYSAFMQSESSPSIFHKHPMSFSDAKTHKILPIWENYYKDLHAKIPQGLPGTNPGQISRESSLDIVYYYGKLRTRPVN